MTERKTPAERMTNYLTTELPQIAAKFPAFNTNAVTSDLSAMVSDADASGAQNVPPLDNEPFPEV